MERYIELIEPFDQNGNEPRSAMATSPNGDWVLYSEAQAEIERLRAELEVKNESIRFLDSARLGWHELEKRRYRTL